MLVCGILAFGKKLEPMKRKTFRMFFFCGISTTFWGIMYGSFFGDAIPTIAEKFFGASVTLNPVWIDPVSEPLTLLIFSVALGLVQILVGLFIKMYMLLRQKRVVEAVCDVGLWIAVLLGIAVLAGGMGLGIDALFNVGAVIACAGGVGLVLTQGRSKKGIIAKLFGGIVSLYDITSYVSDALSYSRLMALGLTTSVIASVVNILGSMGSGVVGAIMFILVFAAGHLLNFAINMLGAYVHTNRLQYVEFYSKFYEGGGRKFEPLAMETKYHRFVDVKSEN
jgi:V/A-type H+-transporting ATPase subunit I